LPEKSQVTAFRLDVVSVASDRVTLSLDCSAGFYVRSLAHDLGEALGTGAHLEQLRRTRSGDFILANCLDLEAAEREPERAARAVVPLSAMLPGLAAVVLTPAGVRRAVNGCDLGPADAVAGESRIPAESRIPNPESRLVRLIDTTGALVGVAEPARTPGLLHPSVVLV
jgi:tRNA pseudouridine55 synthase